MFTTRTGGYGVGFRRGWSDWQKDIDGLATWAKDNGFACIDLGGDADVVGQKVVDKGLKIGSADLKDWGGFMAADPDRRKQALDANLTYIADCVKLGATNFFTVMLPPEAARPRKENFEFMIEGLKPLCTEMEKLGAHLVVEGWPGAGALCCTPESYRAAIDALGSKAFGINYDPSHLMRMGIDPIRFLNEFADHVYHVHGKDTEIIHEDVYEFGTEQPGTLAGSKPFGSMSWRYTIPGHGQVRWVKTMEILRDRGYKGLVSIELEDGNFNVSEQGEKDGFLYSGRFLQGC